MIKYFFVLILCSCSTTSSIRRLSSRHDASAYQIECTDIKDCHSDAKRLCRDAYDTRISSWNPDSGDKSLSHHSITIECKSIKTTYH